MRLLTAGSLKFGRRANFAPMIAPGGVWFFIQI